MGRLSGMEISSSPGLKNPLKLAQGQKFLPPKGRRPAGGKYFFPRADLGGFFNPRDEEIFIPDNHSPFRNCIPVRVIQVISVRRQQFDKFCDWRALLIKECKKKPTKNSSNHNNVNKFLHGSCGNLISFHQRNDDFIIFLKMYGNLSMNVAYLNSYRNNDLET